MYCIEKVNICITLWYVVCSMLYNTSAFFKVNALIYKLTEQKTCLNVIVARNIQNRSTGSSLISI